MPFSSIHAITTVLLAVAANKPVLALPPDQVTNKLDTIIVFAPINPKAPAKILPLKYNLEGKSRSIFFAAFSPSAVAQIINDKITPQNADLAKSLKFAPFSLAKFDSSVQAVIQSDKNARVIYVPDQEQVPIVEKLLVQQGTEKDVAAKVAVSMPAVFCPQPAIKATPSSGPLKGQTFVPCSMDFKTVQDMIDKGVSTNSDLRKTKPKVVAIPMGNFARMLVKGDVGNVGEIRVLPSPSTINALEKARSAAGASTTISD